SRVVLEAMASGLPIITTRFNGAAERIENGSEGYVIDSPMNVEALSGSIERLLDQDHRRVCGARALEAVAGVTMRDHAAKILVLYEEMLVSGEVNRGGYR
ncbi:MAG: glycosyltransferase, partial [Planctomycetota bacterium]